jgi:hypothetical protein
MLDNEFHTSTTRFWSPTIWLRKNVFNSLINCKSIRDLDKIGPVPDSLTTVDGVCLLVWDLNAEFLRPNQNMFRLFPESRQTSSIAITTSTVSKLSKPRSFEKCAVGESYQRSMIDLCTPLSPKRTFAGSETCKFISELHQPRD